MFGVGSLQDEEASMKMKTVKPNTTAPIYIPLSEYKDPEDNSDLPPPPRHRVTPKLRAIQDLDTSHLEKVVDYSTEQQRIVEYAPLDLADPEGRTEGSRDVGESSLQQSISSTVAAVLQAAENSLHQQPLHTLAAAAMMPQSMHPMPASMHMGLQPMQTNVAVPAPVDATSSNNTLPTASCFFGQPQSLVTHPPLQPQLQQDDLHMATSHPEPQQQPQARVSLPSQQQQQQHYSMPVKYEQAAVVQTAVFVNKFEDDAHRSFPQV